MVAYRSKSLTLFLRNKFHDAISYFDRRSVLERLNGRVLDSIECSLWKARFTILTGDYINCNIDLSELHEEHADQIEINPYLLGLYSYLKANIHYYLGNHDECLVKATIAEKCFDSFAFSEQVSVEYLLSLQMLAKAYWKKRDITKALLTLLKGAKQNTDTKTEAYYFALAKSLNLIGAILMDVRRVEAAAPFLQMSHEIYYDYCSSLNKNHLYLGILHSNQAECTLRQNMSAWSDELIYQSHFDRASSIFETLYRKSPHRYSASLLKINARYYKKKKDPDIEISLSTLDDEIRMRVIAFKTTKHSSIARAYNNKSRINIQLSNFKEAIKDAQNALIASIQNFNSTDPAINPSLSNKTQGFSGTEMLKALANKADANLKWYKQQIEVTYLNEASGAVLAALKSTFYILSKNISHTESKFLFLEDTRSLNELAVEILYELIKIPEQERQFNPHDLYELIQYNKSLLLLAEVNSSNYESGQIYTNNEYVQNIRMVKKMHKSANAMLKVLKIEKAIGALASELKELVRVLSEKDSSIDTQEETKINGKSIKSLQEEMENERVATLEFFVGKKKMYGIFLDDREIKVKRLDQESTSVEDIKNIIIRYEKLLSKKIHKAENMPNFTVRTPENKEEIKRTFIKLSHALYKLVISPFSKELSRIERIYIIPDDFLWLLPFETLLYQERYDLSYSSLPYIQEKWLIGYHFSLPLIQHLYIKKKRKRKIQSMVLAISAPDLVLDQQIMNTMISWQDEMTKKLNCIFTVLSPNGEPASETLQKIPGEVVLIWAHGGLNEGIRLDEKRRITMRDIKSAGNLKWKLLIVPNCYLGNGPIKKGEGMISLHRSFFSSGVENMISTVTNLRAQGTINVLTEFFKLLSSKEPRRISEALRLAKIKVSKREDSLPSDWAGLLFIGHQKDHLNNI